MIENLTLSLAPTGAKLKLALDKFAFSWAVREDFYRHMSGQIVQHAGESIAQDAVQAADMLALAR